MCCVLFLCIQQMNGCESPILGHRGSTVGDTAEMAWLDLCIDKTLCKNCFHLRLKLFLLITLGNVLFGSRATIRCEKFIKFLTALYMKSGI